jgi:integrase
MDIVRAGIEALNDGSVVLPAPEFVRQQPSDVRPSLSDSVLSARITEIVERKTERLQTALAELRAELVGESVAVRENNDSESLRQQLAQTQEQLAITTQEFEEAKTNNQRWRDAFKELEGERDNLEWKVGALRDENQRLQTDILYLQQEPKETDADFAKLQESSASVINNLREDLRVLQSRLAEERVERESLQKQLDNGAEQNPASANTQQPVTELGLPEDIKGEKIVGYRDTTGVDRPTFERILQQCDRATLAGKRDYALLRLLWGNALRRNEISQLSVCDFNPVSKTQADSRQGTRHSVGSSGLGRGDGSSDRRLVGGKGKLLAR